MSLLYLRTKEKQESQEIRVQLRAERRSLVEMGSRLSGSQMFPVHALPPDLIWIIQIHRSPQATLETLSHSQLLESEQPIRG